MKKNYKLILNLVLLVTLILPIVTMTVYIYHINDTQIPYTYGILDVLFSLVFLINMLIIAKIILIIHKTETLSKLPLSQVSYSGEHSE